MKYLAPYAILCHEMMDNGLTEEQLLSVMQNLLLAVPVDEAWYRDAYPDVAAAINSGEIGSAKGHFIDSGYAEGRLPFDHELDEEWYLKIYPDVAKEIEAGYVESARQHYIEHGYKEGRLPGKDLALASHRNGSHAVGSITHLTGSASVGAWSYRADPPQRYMGNYHRYKSRGGLVRPHEDVKGFVHNQSGNCGDMARFFSFCLMFDQITKERLRGDIAELGVWKGNTAAVMGNMARRLSKTVYLFDTFEGFIHPTCKA